MSMVGSPDYQRVSRGFVATTPVATRTVLVPAFGSVPVTIGFPSSPDTLLVEVFVPDNCFVYVELQDDNGNVENSRVLGSMNLGSVFSYAIHSLGGPAILHCLNGTGAQVGFSVCVRGFIGVSKDELNKLSDQSDSFGHAINAGATSQTFDPPGSGRFTDLAWVAKCDQAYDVFVDYLTQGTAAAVILSVRLGSFAAGIIATGTLKIPCPAVGLHVVNTSAVNGTFWLSMVTSGRAI